MFESLAEKLRAIRESQQPQTITITYTKTIFTMPDGSKKERTVLNDNGNCANEKELKAIRENMEGAVKDMEKVLADLEKVFRRF